MASKIVDRGAALGYGEAITSGEDVQVESLGSGSDLNCGPTDTVEEIDLPALRAKYAEERDKRLREGQAQYIVTEGDFADFYEADPHMPVSPRDPISADADVVVLGGGFAGLMAGARLKQAGVEDVRIIELGGDFGGTWYWNRYPGIQCDNESLCYIPLLEELGHIPTKRYADGPEIYEHCQRIGKHFGLYEGALFHTLIRSLNWDEGLRRWKIATNRGDEIRARFVIMASGPFNRPKLPGIPGITSFKGRMFHTARWDYTYTGGDSTGGLTKLADKKVAIIGTGATAIQAVPHLGRDAKQLYVFQRTPSIVDQRNNGPIDPEWAKTLKPGWQKERQHNFHDWAFELIPSTAEDMVCDFWTEMSRNMVSRVANMGGDVPIEQLVAMREEEDYRVMERRRRRVDEIVGNKEAAEALKPYYRYFCKRPCSNDDYLATFNRPNVALVDVSGSKGVERITETGIVANGVEYEVDCIILASGFEISSTLDRRFGIDEINGAGGKSLYQHWANGYRTLHGMSTTGFPNQFFTGFIQGGVGGNTTLMLQQQVEHIAYIIGEAQKRGATRVETTQAGQDAWVKTIRDTAIDMTQMLRECTPGYQNNEGEKEVRSLLGDPFGPGFYAFDQLLADWRAKGDLEGLKLES
jgi:cyclohexanone monooxygenase